MFCSTRESGSLRHGGGWRDPMAVRPRTLDQHTDIGSMRQTRRRTRSARFARFARAVFRRQPAATVIVIVFLSVGALAPILAPYDPTAVHMRERLEGPS